MTINSTSSESGAPVFEAGDVVVLRTGIGPVKFRIEMHLADLRQIGTSYRVEHEGKMYFLKLPEVEGKQHWNRVTEEASRGLQINDLIVESDLNSPRTEKENGSENFKFQLAKLSYSGEIVKVVGVDANVAGDHPAKGAPAIVYDYSGDDNLEGIYQKREDADYGQKWNFLRENWFNFAGGLAEVLRRIHNYGMLHGSLVPRNIRFTFIHKDGELAIGECFLVGFGYSSLAFEAATRENSRVPDDRYYLAPETRQHGLGALTSAADIYSMGALLNDLAVNELPSMLIKGLWETGNDGASPHKVRVSKLKEQVRAGLESTPKGTSERLGPFKNHNVATIIDNCLRFDPGDRYEMVDYLAESIEVAQGKPDLQAEGSDSGQVGGFFGYVLGRKRSELHDLEVRLDAKTLQPHHEIFGSRTIIISGLCRLLQQLNKGDQYCTVTLPSYWTDRNLGPDGRFLAMNRHAAQLGVDIKRIFLVSEEVESLSDEEQDILKFQQKSAQDFHNLQVKIQRVTEGEIREFERSGRMVAYVLGANTREESLPPYPNEKENQMKLLWKFISLNFISRGRAYNRYGKFVIEREIIKVRIWDPARGKTFWERFLHEVSDFNLRWKQSVPIEKYRSSRRVVSLKELLENEGKASLR